uniref:Uncharacterized protein n=1 Tax=Knipowitschia caucasica TaxID=637954 RepID=A0AAV2K866_KNICA
MTQCVSLSKPCDLWPQLRATPLRGPGRAVTIKDFCFPCGSRRTRAEPAKEKDKEEISFGGCVSLPENGMKLLLFVRSSWRKLKLCSIVSHERRLYICV